MRLIAFVLSAAAVYPLWAADVETQHAFDVTLPLKPKLELILHSRVRTQPGGLGFYQARAGPIVSWDAAPRMTLLSGYYYARQERKIDNDFIGGHRLFGGAEIAVVETRRFVDRSAPPGGALSVGRSRRLQPLQVTDPVERQGFRRAVHQPRVPLRCPGLAEQPPLRRHSLECAPGRANRPWLPV